MKSWNKLIAKWFSCRITSGRKSALFGIRFSYPIYIILVTFGVLLQNPIIIFITALISLFGIILPMHPLDYLYNYGIAPLIGTGKIAGRGSELQINSIVAFIFNTVVIVCLQNNVSLDYAILALIYVLSSIFFIVMLLSTENLSLNSFLGKKSS